MKFLVFFSASGGSSASTTPCFQKKTIVEIRPPIKVHSHCSARYSRSTKNVQKSCFSPNFRSDTKGISQGSNFFENMIAGPPSKLISFFQNNCCSILGKSNKQRVSYDAIFHSFILVPMQLSLLKSIPISLKKLWFRRNMPWERGVTFWCQKWRF